MVVIVATSDLVEITSTKGKPIECNISPNPSKGFLIKLSHIVEYHKNR